MKMFHKFSIKHTGKSNLKQILFNYKILIVYVFPVSFFSLTNLLYGEFLHPIPFSQWVDENNEWRQLTPSNTDAFGNRYMNVGDTFTNRVSNYAQMGDTAGVLAAIDSRLNAIAAPLNSNFFGGFQYPYLNLTPTLGVNGYGSFNASTNSRFDRPGYKTMPNLNSTSGPMNSYGNFNTGTNDQPSNLIYEVILGYNPYDLYNIFNQKWSRFFTDIFLPSSHRSKSNTKKYNIKSRISAVQSSDTLESRYFSLADQQLRFFYTNTNLSNFRTEHNTMALRLLYLDPWVIYYTYELNTFLTQVSGLEPMKSVYEKIITLSQEIASWTSPPNDKRILKERFQKRSELDYYYALLDYYLQVYFYNNPQQVDYLVNAYGIVNEKLQGLWNNEQTIAWYNEWQDTCRNTHDNAAGYIDVLNKSRQIISDFPDYGEYLGLYRDVIKLLLTFKDHPSSIQVNEMITDVISNNNVSKNISDYYKDYLEQVNRMLSNTDIAAEIERYYEQINGLLVNDTTYNELMSVQYLAIVSLHNLQAEVYDAVYNCSQYPDCNPYEDQTIQNLIYSGNTANLIKAVGEFYELYNLFWHEFYRSSDYLKIEAEAIERIKNTISPIAEELENAQLEYANSVNGIPEVSSLKSAMDNSVVKFCDESFDLDQKLTRMLELVQKLEKD